MADFVPTHKRGDVIGYQVGRRKVLAEVTDVSAVTDTGSDSVSYTLTLRPMAVSDLEDEW